MAVREDTLELRDHLERTGGTARVGRSRATVRRVAIILLAAAGVVVAAWAFQRSRSAGAPAFSTRYQAVVLTSGQVYYGRLENVDGPYPILRDVFYISSQVNPVTKEASNVLVRRGRELHGPEYMMLNRSSILFIEPIGPDSQVAKFIADQNQRK
jgi:hypothetical protein